MQNQIQKRNKELLDQKDKQMRVYEMTNRKNDRRRRFIDLRAVLDTVEQQKVLELINQFNQGQTEYERVTPKPR